MAISRRVGRAWRNRPEVALPRRMPARTITVARRHKDAMDVGVRPGGSSKRRDGLCIRREARRIAEYKGKSGTVVGKRRWIRFHGVAQSFR